MESSQLPVARRASLPGRRKGRKQVPVHGRKAPAERVGMSLA